MKEIKLAIIGGGSRLWAIQFLKDVTLQDKLKVNFSLYDIEKQAALNNVAVGNEIFKANNKEGQFTISVEDTLEDSLKGADFVIITIEPGIMDCRYGDLVLPDQYGILQTVGDTTGPGGIMRARTTRESVIFDFLQPLGEANVFKILATRESSLPYLRYPLGDIYAFQFLTAFKRLLLYFHFPFGDDAHTILYVVAVFLVSCHGSKSYLRQSYEIYFIQPSEIRRNMMNRKERKRTCFCCEKRR